MQSPAVNLLKAIFASEHGSWNQAVADEEAGGPAGDSCARALTHLRARELIQENGTVALTH